jgi:integrase
MPKVNVPGVKVYVSKGKVYAYDRKTSTRLTPPHVIGSPEWFKALDDARAKLKVEPKERPGTWGAVVEEYRKSPRFLDLAPRTKEDYLCVLDYLRPLHAMTLPRWTRGFVIKVRDKAQLKRGRRFANYVQSVVSVVFTFAVERELGVEVNPAAKLKKIRQPKGAPRANRPWSREEWDAVVVAAPPALLAPILLGGVLGYREGEALSAPRASWNTTTGVLTRVSAKSGKIVKVPAPANVADALRALPKHDATTLLVNSRGLPWREDGFRGSFFRLIRQLEAAGKVADGLTFHGLRHTAATRMRRLGFDKETIADMLGQDTPGMAGHYSREADLEPKLRGVVKRIERENRKRTNLSNQA